MKIGIMAATSWEVGGFLRRTQAQKVDERSYRIESGNKKIFLLLSGVGRKRAEEAARKLLEHSPDWVLCTGFAGALKPEICAGDLVLDSEKSSPEPVRFVHAVCHKLQLSLHQGSFYTSDSLIRTAAEKEKIAKETGALAVEMESSAIFQLCSQHSIPSLFVRTVSDGFKQTLPTVLGEFRPQESAGTFLVKALKNPRDWVHFLKFVLSVKRAEKNLTKFLIEFCGSPEFILGERSE